jgi:hypothetical protein
MDNTSQRQYLTAHGIDPDFFFGCEKWSQKHMFEILSKQIPRDENVLIPQTAVRVVGQTPLTHVPGTPTTNLVTVKVFAPEVGQYEKDKMTPEGERTKEKGLFGFLSNSSSTIIVGVLIAVGVSMWMNL